VNSKQRVQAALRRQPVDRIPIFMWFHPETARRLAALLEIPAAAVGDALGNDVCMTWVNNNYAMEGIVHERDGEGHTDDWGITWVKEGPFNQIVGFPLAQATREQALAYQFPVGQINSLMQPMISVAARAQDMFIGCDVSPCIFEMYWRLRGMEQAMLDMSADPELIGAMFARCADFAEMLWTGDDVASQQSLLISPAMWRRLIKPHLARILAVGKRRGLWVAHHCCGALRPIIPDLIEIGLDVLNPVQADCPGMDPLELKREFGRELAFMGGVDTVGVLPHGSVDDVRRATARLIEGMAADGGGYILAASHTVPPETPDDNIFAMYAEAGLSRAAIFDRAAQLRARLHASA
jgi:uroporphyrinogen decarboxylase